MTPYASLGMYPLVPLRPAWDQLWAAVHERAPWTPPSLTWTDDVAATWHDPDGVVTHACGWPVVTSLRDVVDVVGAFTLGLPDADGHRYRAVVLATDDGEPAVDAIAAVNAEDSLTGWVSLRAARSGGQPWPGPVVWTASHIASIRALRAGRADIASIDPLTLHHLRGHEPDLIAGLHVVGTGPLVPSPPIVVPRSTPSERIEELRHAFGAALTARPLVGRALALSGFVGLDRAEYEPLLTLVAAR